MVKAEFGSYTSKLKITKAKNISDIIDIKAGKNFTIALRSTGEVFVTGSNLYGELGNGDASIRKIKEFKKIDGLSDVCKIAAGYTEGIALGIDGKVRSWGTKNFTATLVSELSDIRYVSGGNKYSLAIDKNYKVYNKGTNKYGELGNGTNTDNAIFSELSTINDVLQISGGNTYTVMLKNDGTVWGTGDYAHGDEEIKSKTRGVIPIQVGNDDTGIEYTEVTVEIGKEKDILANTAYEFNLIYLDQNFNDTLTFTSLEEKIATVSEKGIVTGIKTGKTRVNAVSSDNGRVFNVLVKVVPAGSVIAPEIAAGEDFAAVTKADRKHLDIWL